MKLTFFLVVGTLCISLGGCATHDLKSCSTLVNPENADKAMHLVRDHIVETQGTRSLPAIATLYEAPRLYQCGSRVAVSYKLNTMLNNDDGAVVGGDLLYLVSLSTGAIEEVDLGE